MPKYYLQHYGFVGDDESYLAHHGIEGMRWGKRNGPPYPLSDAKHDKVVEKSKKESNGNIAGKSELTKDLPDKKKQKLIKMIKRGDQDKVKIKYTESEQKAVDEASKYGFKSDKLQYLECGGLHFNKTLKFGDNDHRLSVQSRVPEKPEFDFESISKAADKYASNYKKIRDDVIKLAKKSGLYEYMIDNMEKPGEVVWDDYSSILDGKGDAISMSTWAFFDGSQEFWYFPKTGKIRIGEAWS